MTVGDEVILMRIPERPDLTGLRGRIIQESQDGGLQRFRVSLHGKPLPDWLSAYQLEPGKPPKRKK